MDVRLKNATGVDQGAKIDANFRLHTQTVTESESVHATEKGNAYNLNTGYITFTSGGDGTLLYFKNDEEQDFIVEAIAIGTASTGVTYSEYPYVTIVRNPTGGDLISDATAGDIKQNRSFGSNKTLKTTSLFYKGKVSGTLTGGNDFAILQTSKGGRDLFTLNINIPRGSDIGIKVTNNASAANVDMYCAIIGFIKDKESSDA